MYIQKQHTHATPDWPGPNKNWTHTIYAINPLFRGVPEKGNCCCLQKHGKVRLFPALGVLSTQTLIKIYKNEYTQMYIDKTFKSSCGKQVNSLQRK